MSQTSNLPMAEIALVMFTIMIDHLVIEEHCELPDALKAVARSWFWDDPYQWSWTWKKHLPPSDLSWLPLLAQRVK